MIDRFALALTGFFVLAPPSQTSAQAFEIAVGTSIAVTGTFAVTMVVADTISFALDSPWDDGWAIVDIVAGGVLVAGWAALSIAALVQGLENDAYGRWHLWAAASIAPGLLGGYLLSHGIWSLSENDRAPPPRAIIAPTDGGAIVQVFGLF